ncbi:MAG: glycerate kinase [Opitutus sp.]
MRVLLAFDKFKDAVSARTACTIAADALRELHPSWEFDLCPLTDGGEGFTEILTESAKGKIQSAEVTGPRGAPLRAPFGLAQLAQIPEAARARLALPSGLRADGTIAIIEMAAASGLALLGNSDRDPWQTSTFGTGELMRIAQSRGAAVILLGLGGSATNDLGLGALAALGLEFRSEAGEKLPSTAPVEWSKLARITGSIPAGFPPVRVACDVTNPLLGSNGCAAVYGPQKGLKPADLPLLEAESTRVAHLLCDHLQRPTSLIDEPGAGAAGGIAFGLMAGTDARVLSGFDLTAEWFDLRERIRAADVVLTGEGRFDLSSDQGKGPGAILTFAAEASRPAHVFAGQVSVASHRSAQLHQISPATLPRAEAIRSTPALLRAAIQRQFAATT